MTARDRPADDRGARVRLKLLHAAIELIGELGWNAVSTRVLADRAGVAPGLVHYHFRSLPALLREAAVGMMREMLTATRPVLDEAADAEQGMAALLGTVDGYTGDDPTSLVFIEAYLAATRDPELHRELAVLVAEFRDGLAAWLAEHGQPRPSQTASVLAATFDGILLHRSLNPELTSTAVLPVLRGLLTPGDPATTRGTPT